MNQTDPTAALRDRIANVLARADGWGYASGTALRDMGASTREHYDNLADAVLAVIPEPTSRAAVLRWAADELGRMDYDTDSNDYGYDTYRDAWNGGVMDGANLLRRLAVEAHSVGTQQQPDTEALTAEELAHALDNSTPYPIELDGALCRFMAERLLEMTTAHKRPEHAVWQPDEELPADQPAPIDPATLASAPVAQQPAAADDEETRRG